MAETLSRGVETVLENGNLVSGADILSFRSVARTKVLMEFLMALRRSSAWGGVSPQ